MGCWTAFRHTRNNLEIFALRLLCPQPPLHTQCHPCSNNCANPPITLHFLQSFLPKYHEHHSMPPWCRQWALLNSGSGIWLLPVVDQAWDQPTRPTPKALSLLHAQSWRGCGVWVYRAGINLQATVWSLRHQWQQPTQVSACPAHQLISKSQRGGLLAHVNNLNAHPNYAIVYRPNLA